MFVFIDGLGKHRRFRILDRFCAKRLNCVEKV